MPLLHPRRPDPRPLYPRHRILLFGLFGLFGLCTLPAVISPAVLGSDKTLSDGHLGTYRIGPLIIHTDLTAAAADALAGRVKSVLDDAAYYWKRPVRGPFECFVLDDPNHWEDHQLPHPLARLMIAQVGGATQSRQVGHGVRARNMVRVFAAARPGVVEHEIVHAYCGQAFCATGPLWYQEGMAQLFAHGTDRKQGVNCPAAMLRQLQSKPRMTIAQTVSGGQATKQLIRQFGDKQHRNAGLVGLIPTDNWDESDVDALQKIKKFYCWNWFLCHFLFHNPNYRSDFRRVGQAFLVRRQDQFAAVFQPMGRELEFEYQFALDHLVDGYRVDLCSWDWQEPIRQLRCAHSHRAHIAAARGYQAAGVMVEAGRYYHYRTEGTWSRWSSSAVSADGSGRARGNCLEGVVFHNYQLSAPFTLSKSGKFRAPCTGSLHVRCRADWAHVSENEGGVVLVLDR